MMRSAVCRDAGNRAGCSCVTDDRVVSLETKRISSFPVTFCRSGSGSPFRKAPHAAACASILTRAES